jgi:hypothetical protein
LAERSEVPGQLVDAAKRLDEHYIPSRYPNGYDHGAPTDCYTEDEARAAVEDTGRIIRHCRDSLGWPARYRAGRPRVGGAGAAAPSGGLEDDLVRLLDHGQCHSIERQTNGCAMLLS